MAPGTAASARASRNEMMNCCYKGARSSFIFPLRPDRVAVCGQANIIFRNRCDHWKGRLNIHNLSLHSSNSKLHDKFLQTSALFISYLLTQCAIRNPPAAWLGQVGKRCRFFPCQWRISGVKPFPSYSTLCQLDLVWALFAVLSVHSFWSISETAMRRVQHCCRGCRFKSPSAPL